jgi:hypothetical protein
MTSCRGRRSIDIAIAQCRCVSTYVHATSHAVPRPAIARFMRINLAGVFRNRIPLSRPETALTRQPSRDSPHETALTRHRLRRSSAPRSHPPDFMRINNHSSTRRRTQDTPLSRSLRIAKPKPPQRPIKRNPTPISIAPHQAPRCRLATIQASPLLP